MRSSFYFHFPLIYEKWRNKKWKYGCSSSGGSAVLFMKVFYPCTGWWPIFVLISCYNIDLTFLRDIIRYLHRYDVRNIQILRLTTLAIYYIMKIYVKIELREFWTCNRYKMQWIVIATCVLNNNYITFLALRTCCIILRKSTAFMFQPS